MPGEQGRLDPASNHPLDGGRRVGVGCVAGESDRVVDASSLRSLDGHFVRCN